MTETDRVLIVPPASGTQSSLGIAAPASPFDSESFQKGVEILKTAGFQVSCSSGIYEREAYLAGSDQNRARSLNDLWADSGVAAILCARGGYGSLRLLELLDFQVPAQHPKRFVGFSDVTALLNALSMKSGIVAFHGPMVTSLSDLNEASKERLFEVLIQDDLSPRIWPDVSVLVRGTSTGRLVGGNLTVLCHTLGTPFEPDFRSAVLLMEDVGEPMYRIDRCLTHLHLTGRLERLAGILIGDFKGGPPKEEIWNRVLDLWGTGEFPIWGDVPVGHGPRNEILPIGMTVQLDSYERRIVFVRP